MPMAAKIARQLVIKVKYSLWSALFVTDSVLVWNHFEGIAQLLLQNLHQG